MYELEGTYKLRSFSFHCSFGNSNNNFHCLGKSQWWYGTTCHYTLFQLLPWCCIISCFYTELNIIEIHFKQVGNWFGYVEKLKHCPYHIMRNCAKCELKKKNVVVPNVFVKSRKTTCRSFFSIFVVCIWCHIILVCSKHPENPVIPAFCIEVSIKLFCIWYADNVWVKMLKKIFPSTFRRLICWNCSIVAECFCFGSNIPAALLHAFGIFPFIQTIFMSLHKNFITSGVFL